MFDRTKTVLEVDCQNGTIAGVIFNPKVLDQVSKINLSVRQSSRSGITREIIKSVAIKIAAYETVADGVKVCAFDDLNEYIPRVPTLNLSKFSIDQVAYARASDDLCRKSFMRGFGMKPSLRRYVEHRVIGVWPVVPESSIGDRSIHVLSEMRKRVVTEIVEKCSQAEKDDVLRTISEVGLQSLLSKHPAHYVCCSQGMGEAAVGGSWEDEVGEPELSNMTKSLKLRGVDQILLKSSQPDASVD